MPFYNSMPALPFLSVLYCFSLTGSDFLNFSSALTNFVFTELSYSAFFRLLAAVFSSVHPLSWYLWSVLHHYHLPMTRNLLAWNTFVFFDSENRSPAAVEALINDLKSLTDSQIASITDIVRGLKW